jgi:hypothetical protein
MPSSNRNRRQNGRSLDPAQPALPFEGTVQVHTKPAGAAARTPFSTEPLSQSSDDIIFARDGQPYRIKVWANQKCCVTCKVDGQSVLLRGFLPIYNRTKPKMIEGFEERSRVTGAGQRETEWRPFVFDLRRLEDGSSRPTADVAQGGIIEVNYYEMDETQVEAERCIGTIRSTEWQGREKTLDFTVRKYDATGNENNAAQGQGGAKLLTNIDKSTSSSSKTRMLTDGKEATRLDYGISLSLKYDDAFGTPTKKPSKSPASPHTDSKALRTRGGEIETKARPINTQQRTKTSRGNLIKTIRIRYMKETVYAHNRQPSRLVLPPMGSRSTQLLTGSQLLADADR